MLYCLGSVAGEQNKMTAASTSTPTIDDLPMDTSKGFGITKLYPLIRDVPDFPKPGIVYKDITPLLRDEAGLSLAVEFLTQPFRRAQINVVAAAESRGFIFAAAVARNLSAGFVPIRKPGL